MTNLSQLEQDQNESVKSSGKNVEEAITNGLQQLNLSRQDVDIVVIKQGSRGILGLGAEDAVVLLTPKPIPAQPEPEEEPATGDFAAEEIVAHEETTANDASFTQDQGEDSGTATESAQDIDGELQDRAREILKTLLEKMSIEAEVTPRIGDDLVEPGENAPLTLDITGSDLGLLIGRRGETLRALQFVTRQILNKEAGRWVPLVVDVESYLVRRRKTLQQLANRMADRVVFSGRRAVLEPMPAQDRRIVHLELRDHEHVYTNSIGEGDKRKVVILPR